MKLLPDSMVFQIVGGYVIASPAHHGLFIDLVFSTVPGALSRYFPFFVKQCRALGYRRLFCRPVGVAQARLYRRFGFVEEGNGDLLVLELF